MRIVIVGAGGHAQVVADSLLLQQSLGGQLQPVGFVDDDPKLHGKYFLGLSVLGSLADLNAIGHDAVIIGIGHNRARQDIFIRLQSQGVKFVNVLHPTAIVSPFAALGTGTVLCAGAIVNPGASIGDNVILNTGSTVDHDCQVRSHSHIAPGAHLAGAVQVDFGVLVGIGAVIRQGQSLGAWCVVGAGAVVVDNIPDGVTVVGVPARQIFTENTA